MDISNKFHIIYADPPWQYKDKKKRGRTKCGAENHYNCMALEDIKNLPIQTISEDNSVCFLWVTFPLLKEGIDVLETWGFKYKTIGFNWIKTRNNKIWHGIGTYTKSNSELCLFGTRGKIGRLMKDSNNNIIITDPKIKLRVKSNFVSSIIQSPLERHSKKPDIIRDKIVELFGDISRVELFARQITPGWISWGNEVQSNFTLLPQQNLQA